MITFSYETCKLDRPGDANTCHLRPLNSRTPYKKQTNKHACMHACMQARRIIQFRIFLKDLSMKIINAEYYRTWCPLKFKDTSDVDYDSTNTKERERKKNSQFETNQLKLWSYVGNTLPGTLISAIRPVFVSVLSSESIMHMLISGGGAYCCSGAIISTSCSLIWVRKKATFFS